MSKNPTLCAVCNNIKRVQLVVKSFHAAGVTYFIDCPGCQPPTNNMMRVTNVNLFLAEKKDE